MTVATAAAAMSAMPSGGAVGGAVVTVAATTTSPTHTHQPLMSLEAYTAAAVSLALIGFVGFFCNLVVIVVFIRDRQVSATETQTPQVPIMQEGQK